MHILMPTQSIAETECTLNLQSQGHVASNMHSRLVHFNGLDVVALGHLWADSFNSNKTMISIGSHIEYHDGMIINNYAMLINKLLVCIDHLYLPEEFCITM